MAICYSGHEELIQVPIVTFSQNKEEKWPWKIQRQSRKKKNLWTNTLIPLDFVKTVSHRNEVLHKVTWRLPSHSAAFHFSWRLPFSQWFFLSLSSGHKFATSLSQSSALLSLTSPSGTESTLRVGKQKGSTWDRPWDRCGACKFIVFQMCNEC